MLDFRVAADGKHVVYLARLDGDSSLHPYLVDVRRPSSYKLLDPRPCFGIELAAKRLLYTRFEGDAVFSSLELDDDLTPVELGPGNSAQLTPDGLTVVVQRSDGLYRVPADGSALPKRIHAAPSIHFDWRLSPDNRRVLFITDGSIGGQAGYGHLYSAPLDGSGPAVALNTSAMPAKIGSFLVSPDSRWVVFLRMILGTQRGAGICRAPLDGSAPAVQINPTLPSGAFAVGFTELSAPRFAADGKRVLYRMEQDVAGLQELYSAPLDGSSPPVKVNDDESRFLFTHRVSADGTRVVYNASASSFDDPFELFWAPTSGGAPPLKLNAPLQGDETVFLFAIAPDNRTVVYRTQTTAGASALFSVSMDGAPHPLPMDLPDQRCFALMPEEIQFAAHGFVIYPVSSGPPVAPKQLFTAQLQGLVPARPLNGPMAPGGSVTGNASGLIHSGPWTRLAAGGTLALFRADQEQDERFELWAAPIVLARPSVRSH